MKILNKFILAGSVLITSACFEYNPNQIILDGNEENLTSKNLALIQSVPVPDTIRIIFMGDTQRFYDESAEFVKNVNKIDNLSFVIHGGDISDFGLAQEYRWINEIMSDLYVPYLTVIGNHDLLANGREVYEDMYGNENYSFKYGNYKFIMLNTNSREYNFNGHVPDLDWLKVQLADNPENKNVIVISHVPPFDADFDQNLEMGYVRILADDPHVILSLHAHTHSFLDKEYYNDGVRYFVTTSMQKKGYALLKLWNDGMSLQKTEY